MNEDETARQEIYRPEFWSTDTMKAKLLEGANGKLSPSVDYPSKVLLNDIWRGILDDIYYRAEVAHGGRATFFFEHPEENARIVKTNAQKDAVLIQTKNIKGEDTYVIIDSSKVKPPEIFLGILHKHPQEVLFSSEDMLPMIAKDGHFIAGVVTPAHYYLAFRASDTRMLTSNVYANRGYLLAMARAHHASVSTAPPNNVSGFSMTPEMFRELKMPLYEGTRSQPELHRV